MEKELKIGSLFNGLLILRLFREQRGKENHKREWAEYKCPCGKIGITRQSKIITGHTKSCGCRLARKKFPTNAPMLPKVDTLSAYYNQMVYDSNVRGLIFTLDKSQFKSIVTKRCNYCGSEGTRIIKHGGVENTYIGIDRINNKEGYVENNVTPCCSKCNMAKGKQTQEEFKQWINRVHEFQNK